MKEQFALLRQNDELWSIIKTFFSGLLQLLPKPALRVFFLHAWPDIEEHREDYWTLLFVKDIAKLFQKAGLKPLLDLKHITEFRDVHAFCEQAAAVEFVCVFGTPALMTKYYDQKFHAEVAALSHVCQKQFRDLKSNRNRVFPIELAKGEGPNLPKYMSWHKSVDWTSGSLITHLKGLVQLMTGDVLKTAEIESEWQLLNQKCERLLGNFTKSKDPSSYLDNRFVRLQQSEQYAVASKARSFESSLNVLAVKPASCHPVIGNLEQTFQLPTLPQDNIKRGVLMRELMVLMKPSVNSGNLGVTLLGPPGIGKTHLAIQYAHLSMSEYDYVIWLRADNDNDSNLTVTLRLQFSTISQLIRKDIYDNSDEYIDFVFDTLSGYRVLVIIDNIHSPEIISDFLRKARTRLSVLITSRNMVPDVWGNEFLLLHVGSLEQSESDEYIRASLDAKQKKYTPKHLKDLTQFVDGVPLLLSQALVTLKKDEIERYLHEVVRDSLWLIEQTVAVTNHYRSEKLSYACYREKTIHALTIITNSYNQLATDAQSLLHSLILFNISEPILLSLLRLNSEPLVRQLLTLGLVVPLYHSEAIMIPRHVQLVVTYLRKDYILQDCVSTAIELLNLLEGCKSTQVREGVLPHLNKLKDQLSTFCGNEELKWRLNKTVEQYIKIKPIRGVSHWNTPPLTKTPIPTSDAVFCSPINK